MLTFLEKIKKNIKCLPVKDQSRAEAFIKARDFDSLLEIVSSLVYMVNKNDKSEKKNPHLDGLSIDDLLNLQSDIVMYSCLLLERSPKEMEDNYDDNEIEYEF